MERDVKVHFIPVFSAVTCSIVLHYKNNFKKSLQNFSG